MIFTLLVQDFQRDIVKAAEAFTAVGYKHIEAGKKWTGSLWYRLYLYTV